MYQFEDLMMIRFEDLMMVRFEDLMIFHFFLPEIRYCITFAKISIWGALKLRAEIILIEPAPGNAGEGI